MLDTLLLLDLEPSYGVGKLSVSLQEQALAATLVELAADIVSAYVSKNSVPVGELAGLIASVYTSLTNLKQPASEEPEKLTPPVPIKKTVTPDYIISLEDGKQYKSLKRHLSSRGSLPRSTVASGVCRTTTPWWQLPTLLSARSLPRTADWVGPARQLERFPTTPCQSALR